jgi:hypothetical protein
MVTNPIRLSLRYLASVRVETPNSLDASNSDINLGSKFERRRCDSREELGNLVHDTFMHTPLHIRHAGIKAIKLMADRLDVNLRIQDGAVELANLGFSQAYEEARVFDDVTGALLKVFPVDNRAFPCEARISTAIMSEETLASAAASYSDLYEHVPSPFTMRGSAIYRPGSAVYM